MQSAGPPLTPANILWSHSFSSFISFSMNSFHESLIPFSSTVTLPDTPFRQFDPAISCVSCMICFAIWKISFWWLGLFKSLAHSFYFFPFAKEITLFLYSFHASVIFFPISMLFCFSLTASGTSSFCHHVFLCLHGPFDSPHVWPVLFPLYFSCVTSVHLHQGISTLLSLRYLWPCFGMLHMSLPLWVSIHALLVETSYTVFLLH